MSIPSIGSPHLQGSSGGQSHQAIGKNGSFWMPQNIDGSFAAKFQNSSNQKTAKANTKTSEGTGNANQSVKPSPSKGPKANQPSTESGRTLTPKSAHGNHSPTVPKLGGHPAKLSNVRVASGVRGASQPFQPTVSSGEPIFLPKTLKSQRNISRSIPQSEVDARDSINPELEDKGNGAKHRQRRGAKNALTNPKMDTVCTDQEFKAMEVYSAREVSTAPAPSVQGRVILKFLTQAVSPRISYLDTNSKKVVRFAVDLPNKTKLGVRLEKAGDSLSISFICSDKESLELLGFTKEGLTDSLQESSGKDIKINIFTNYKEMDVHFSRAA